MYTTRICVSLVYEIISCMCTTYTVYMPNALSNLSLRVNISPKREHVKILELWLQQAIPAPYRQHIQPAVCMVIQTIIINNPKWPHRTHIISFVEEAELKK